MGNKTNTNGNKNKYKGNEMKMRTAHKTGEYVNGEYTAGGNNPNSHLPGFANKDVSIIACNSK